MAGNESGEKGGPTRHPCIVCQEPIRNGATKCIKCDSYQNWRRYLDFSATILALLIALISTISLSAPALKNLFVRPAARFSFTFQGFQGEELLLLVSNTGNAPGTISDGIIPDLRSRLRLVDPAANAFITPGAKLVRYSPDLTITLAATQKQLLGLQDDRGVKKLSYALMIDTYGTNSRDYGNYGKATLPRWAALEILQDHRSRCQSDQSYRLTHC